MAYRNKIPRPHPAPARNEAGKPEPGPVKEYTMNMEEVRRRYGAPGEEKDTYAKTAMDFRRWKKKRGM